MTTASKRNTEHIRLLGEMYALDFLHQLRGTRRTN
jgi:hypothetical protein